MSDYITADSILKLQRAAYKIEADMIGFYDIPPLNDTLVSLRESGEVFYGYHVNYILAGIISFKVCECVLDIHKVAVDPRFFRRGIAEKMLLFVEKLHSETNKIVVCTGKDNLPAIRLYLKMGYQKKRDIEISQSVYVTELEKTLK